MNTSTATQAAPTTPGEVQEIVRNSVKVLPHGARTKSPLLSTRAGEVTQLDMTGLTGIIEYEPGEYTFTAYAGTPLAEIAAALAEHGQYMPFDPPLIDARATLGGTIAAGLSGSRRYRYGGLRDFILGVQIVDGQGRSIRGGGKVVKNAAGFDLPKLMVGAQGRLGIILSASFKVFPAPPATATLVAALPSLAAALDVQAQLMGGAYDLEALDLLPQADENVTLQVRIGGPADVLAARLQRLRAIVGSGDARMDDAAIWHEVREFAWCAANHALVKVPTTSHLLPALDAALREANAPRRYAVGGNVAWIAWPDAIDACHDLLTQHQTRGLIVRGTAGRANLGLPLQSGFLTRVQSALDPHHRFVDFE